MPDDRRNVPPVKAKTRPVLDLPGGFLIEELQVQSSCQRGQLGEPMSEFYVHDDWAVRRCLASYTEQRPDSVAGVDASDLEVKLFTGVVQSVQDCGLTAAYGRRWRILMRHDYS